MKRFASEFFRRGISACGIGPVILAVIYLVLYRSGAMDTLDVRQVCIGIFSLSALAFTVGGMNVIYQIERLPLMGAILIHGSVLYVSYLAAYLLNGWLEQGKFPFLVFTAVFIAGYLDIWAVIYCVIKRNTARLNKGLVKKREGSDKN
ncbi:MAG: DUF3021 domain-containing protein [Ruminococcaceae bacterium]|nr:DUF3021 domain-containing protein [Oscillospiraceae bacterium]